VRQAAVHGFSKAQLYEAEMALQDSSVHQRVEASTSPVSMDTKVGVGKKHHEGLDGCTADDDVAVVGEVAAAKDIAGVDPWRLCSNGYTWSAVGGKRYSH